MVSLTMAGENHKLKAQLTHRNNLLIAPCSQGLLLRFSQGFLGRLRRSRGPGSRLRAKSSGDSGYAATSTGTSAGGPRPWAVFSQNDGVTTSCHPALTAAMDIMIQ
jgi:hypothetical protein